MKILTRVVIDIKTLQVIEEESYNYSGLISECKGGGGASGAVSHSAYLETIHGDWLDATGTDTIEKSITEVMDTALGNSPWTGLTAYDPSADITAYEAALTAFKAILTGVSETADWNTLYGQARTTIDNAVDIAADVAAFADQIDDEITTKVLPRFRRGMQDINAVVSSAFVIGEAVIEGFRNREVAKYSSSLRMTNAGLIMSGTEMMLKLMIQRIGWEDGYARTFVESKRLKIVAKKEQTDQDAKLDEEDALWDLEVFQYGSNLLAAIGGGTAVSKVKGPSTTQSAIGGAMTGAAAGTMIMPGWGTAIGAVIGAGSAFL